MSKHDEPDDRELAEIELRRRLVEDAKKRQAPTKRGYDKERTPPLRHRVYLQHKGD